MLIGWVIEIMILRETIFATQIELFRNRAGWQEVKSFYIARNELQQFVDGLKNGEAALLPPPTLRAEKEPILPDSPEEEDKTLLLLDELKNLLEGNALSPSLNGQAKGRK